MKRLIQVGLIVSLSMIFIIGCSMDKKQCQSSWENGAFYGYAAAQNGANWSNYLLKAYELKNNAKERVKSEDAELEKYR